MRRWCVSCTGYPKTHNRSPALPLTTLLHCKSYPPPRYHAPCHAFLFAVPFGKHAFFPGELRHTNELMVHLGGGYRAECTAAHAAGILSRRMAVIDRDIAQVQAEMQGLHDRLAVAGAELGGSGGGGGGGSGGGRIQEDEGAFEIRETYEESEALLRSAAAAASASGSTASQPVPVGRHRPAEDRVGAAKDSDLDRVFARMAELELLEAQQEEEEALQGGSSSEGVRALDAATAEGGQGSSFPDMQAMFAPVPFLGRADGAQQRPSMAAAAAAAPLTVTPKTIVSAKASSSPLKKGFLVRSTGGGGESSPRGEALPGGASAASAEGVREEEARRSHFDTAPPPSAGSIARREAFTGAVVERSSEPTSSSSSPSAPDGAGVSPGEAATAHHDDVAVVAAAAPGGIEQEQMGKRVSRFKMQSQANKS